MSRLPSVSPKFVAYFEDIQDQDERAIGIREAYERVTHLLRALGMPRLLCPVSSSLTLT